MKIVLIGATGTIGKALSQKLSGHSLIRVGSSSGDYQVDIEDRASIKALFDKTGDVDAVISTTGMVAFAPVDALSIEQIKDSVNSKLVGQINVFQVGRAYVRNGGSITLTSGVLARYPMTTGSAASTVNAAIDAFVKATAFELNDEIRLNVVSPHFVKETMEMMGMDSESGISAADTANAYLHALKTPETGKSFDVAAYV